MGGVRTEGSFAMKNLKRIVFGVLSSLLFAVGFARAAEQFDPLTRSLGWEAADALIKPVTSTSTECDVVAPSE